MPYCSARTHAAGAILALVVVFRNSVSHQRYNDARSAISEVCAGIRSFAVVLHSTTTLEGLDEESKAAKPAFKEAVKLCIVRTLSSVPRVSCGREAVYCASCSKFGCVGSPVRFCTDPLCDDHRGGAGLA
ncbi:bestrophin family ion channel [Silvimonas sp.]|uniref:bestrophin family ion channel n=1 Tax=Silvimonas sp. TaxID=2650811 RepID=UPI00386E9161